MKIQQNVSTQGRLTTTDTKTYRYPCQWDNPCYPIFLRIRIVFLVDWARKTPTPRYHNNDPDEIVRLVVYYCINGDNTLLDAKLAQLSRLDSYNTSQNGHNIE